MKTDFDKKEIILEWANDKLEFDVEKGFVCHTKKQKGVIKMTRKQMSIEEKIALLKYAKRELRVLLIEDKYLEIDFIADELGVNKKDVLELIKSIVSEKGKQRRKFK